MGQSLSHRRPAPIPMPTASPSMATSRPRHPDNTHTSRRSLPRRILSSIRKPSLRSPPLASLTVPTRPEQTLRGKKRRWRLSRRRNVSEGARGVLPEHMDTLMEHDEHQVDRDVDEFGVITHRVPDNHSDSPAASAKGKEREKNVEDIEHDNEHDDNAPIPSTSTAVPLTQSGASQNPLSDEVAIPSTDHPRHPSPLPPAQEPEHPFVVPFSSPHPFPPQPLAQQANTSLRPFPPPGTLVVVQGVVHTTDVPRSSDRPLAASNPTLPPTNDALNSSSNTNSDPTFTRPTSLPPETRSRNSFTGILPRPSSMVPAIPSSEPTITSPNIDPASNTSGADEDSEDEDRTYPHSHGVSMAQGPAGAPGLSASSIDVLGTLLSVAAAATAASLLTGSSEPIFSSGLTSSQPPPSSGSISQPMGFSSNVPSERPLSPTPTSDAGRMRHVWSSLRDRLGLGNGTHSSAHDTTPALGPGQITPPQTPDVVRPRDPREVMLAEMARAFNLGLGLGGATASVPPTSANANTVELASPDDGNVIVDDRDGEQTSVPPPDSFERFLMDLQADLRVTLAQVQESGIDGGGPRNANETVEDTEGDQAIPELQSLSDSDSEEFGDRHVESDDEGPLDDEYDVDNGGDEEDTHTAQEQLSGRTSPLVSTLDTDTRYPLGVRPNPSPSLGVGGISLSHRASSRSAIFPGMDRESDGVGYASSNVSDGIGNRVPADDPGLAAMSEDESEGLGEGALLGVEHSQQASNRGRRVEAEGCSVSGSIAVPQHDVENPPNVPEIGIRQDSFLLETLPSPGPSTSNTPNLFPESLALTSQPPTETPTLTSPPFSDPGPTIQGPSSTNPTSGNSSMPFRLPFTPSSASRTEHTPGGGINWWRMYRFPAIASPNNTGQQGGPQVSPPSQSTFRTSAQAPSNSPTPPLAGTTDLNQQNEMITSRGVFPVPGAHSRLAQQVPSPFAATPTHMPENVFVSNQSIGPPPPPSTDGQAADPLTNTSTILAEHRGNIVVPVIVVGLQSVNMDRQPPHAPPPHANHTSAIDDEDGQGLELDGLEPPLSMPLHIPEPAGFRHHSSNSNTTQQEQSGHQPSRGRTWQSRAANAIRNLRPSRRNADATSPQPQETPGSRTFLIYVIGGYYPPDHQIITGGNLDSFEALWELAELLGQVKPPTVSKEDIEKSGLEIINASMLGDYERQGRVASNCIDRCLICLDDYNAEDELRVLTCKHTFHQGCVDRWLETGRNNCPACRTKGVSNENAPASGSAVA